MSVKAYIANEFERDDERSFFKELLDILEICVSDEQVWLIGNIQLPTTQIDALLIKKNIIICLDFKDYEGTIIGNENGEWYVERQVNGRKERVNIHKNCYQQARRQRRNMRDILKDAVARGECLSRFRQYFQEEGRVFEHIKAWMYFNRGSEYDHNQIRYRRDLNWFKVVTPENVCEEVKRASTETYHLTEEDVKDILKLFKAKEWKEWKADTNEYRSDIMKLARKYKDDIKMLDALYQWATNPTSMSAVIHRRRPPSHELIKENLKIRYGLRGKEPEKVYNKLMEEIESMGIDFSGGFINVEHEVREYFDENDILKNEVLRRLENATDREKYIVWLFCKLEGNPEIWLNNEKFGACLIATFNTHVAMPEVHTTLIKLGFLNKLEWVSSTHRWDRRPELEFPHYLQPIAENIDEYISLPELPDFRKSIDDLFEKKQVETLVGMEELLKDGWIEKQNMTGRVIPYTSIVGENGNVLALNWRIYESLKEYFFERKGNELQMVDEISKIFNQLVERHYPHVSFEEKAVFKAAKVWEIHSMNNLLSEKDIWIIYSPWLTGEQLKFLKNKCQNKYVVILTTMMGIPELNNVYRRIFDKDIKEEDSDWIILDAVKDNKIFEMIINKKPKLYDEIVNELKKIHPSPVEEETEQTEMYILPKEIIKPPRTLEEAKIEAPQPSVIQPLNNRRLKVYLGRGEGGEIFWEPGKLNNGHFIIVGGSGAGKTETIRCIASELNKQSFPVLMIDFHGDMAPSNCEVQTYKIRENGDYYFNPFELNDEFEEITPLRAASDFVDAISINFPSLGIQQRNRLKDIIKKAYEESGITHDPRTWSKELPFERIEQEIKTSEDKITKTLKAYLDDLFEYKLFSAKNKTSIEDIIKRPKITHIHLRRLPESLRVLYADLLLRKVYYTLQALGEIPRGDIEDKERFRIFVIVDEAKMLVSEKQGIKAVLNKYATELRKFGVGLILASQTIDHFNDEILSNVALKLCMKAENKREALKNSKFFGVDAESLTTLNVGEGILIMDNKKTKIGITPTWERGNSNASQ